MTRPGGGRIFGGLILILIGLWFLLDNLGVRTPHLGDLWPLVPLLGGLAFIVSYLTGRERDAGVLVPGCGGFMVGLFFLAFTLGPLDWDDMGAWWPVFPIIGGLTFITLFVMSKERDAGILVPGCGGLLVGLFFFLFTLGRFEWDDMGRLWPAFPLIGGLVFLGVWLFKRSDVGLLVPAGLGLAVGLVGFLFTLGGLGLRWLALGWPILLIVIGLALVARSLVRTGRGD